MTQEVQEVQDILLCMLTDSWAENWKEELTQSDIQGIVLAKTIDIVKALKV